MWEIDENNLMFTRTPFGKRVYFVDLTTLFEGTWLNDQVIFQILTMFFEQSQETGTGVFIRDTFFINKLYTENYYEIIMGWTKGNIFLLYKRIIIPEHYNGNHWVIIVVILDEKRIERYCSMGGEDETAIFAVFQWLRLENIFKNNGEFDMDLDSWILVHVKIRLQRNYNDCGMFALLHAAAAMGIQIKHHEVTQDRIPALRLLFIEMLCTGMIVDFNQNRIVPEGKSKRIFLLK